MQTSGFEPRYAASIAAASVDAVMGRTTDAKKAFYSVLEDAHRHGYFGYELEARLRLGKLELRSGNTVAGRARLEQLLNDAEAKGFLLIARKSRART